MVKAQGTGTRCMVYRNNELALQWQESRCAPRVPAMRMVAHTPLAQDRFIVMTATVSCHVCGVAPEARSPR